MNQVRFTNVSVVRLKKGGKRFEIVCYKNKVLPWRNNTKGDIDEVLQTRTIFTNVSKGQAAKKEDLTKCFVYSDETEICKEILTRGELQLSEKDHQSEMEARLKSVVTSVAALCVNPETRSPYPTAMIEKSLRDAHFVVKMNKDTMQQTMDAIKLLREKMPIERSRMKVRVTFEGKGGGHKLQQSVNKYATKVENEEWQGSTLKMFLLIDPGNYKIIEDLIRAETKGKGSIELLELKAVVENDYFSK